MEAEGGTARTDARRGRYSRAVGDWRPRPFRPTWWLPGPHAQTLVGRLLRAGAEPRYRRERWETPDGDFLDVDFWDAPLHGEAAPVAAHARRDGEADREGDPVRGPRRGPARPGPTSGAVPPPRPGSPVAPEERPLVLVLHGLEGCSESGYVVQTCRRLARHGLRAVALNFRSRSGEPNRARRFYHSGETGDLARVLDRLAGRAPAAPLGVVGYSLGGNVLLKHLGEEGEAARRRVDAAVAVSVPFRLSESADALERGLGPFYARWFLRSLRSSVREKTERYGHRYDLPAPSRLRTLRDFDDTFTAPVHGFEDAEDYYRRSSSSRYLPSVRVPTLLLQARDDPFLPDRALPGKAARENPWLALHLTERGGHLGFVEGRAPWRASFWAEEEAARFLAGALLPRGP